MQTLVVKITNINDKALEEADKALKAIDTIVHIGERKFNGEVSIDLEIIGDTISRKLLATIFSAFALQCTLQKAKV